VLTKIADAHLCESEDQLGTFSEITLDKKISRYCPFKVTETREFVAVNFFLL
jgi:hypothetical protein